MKATAHDRKRYVAVCTSPPLEEEPLLLLDEDPLLKLEAELEDELGDELDDELDEPEEDDELPPMEEAWL